MAGNPYAFPSPEQMSGEYGAYTIQHPGMSLRDYFAGQALAVAFANHLPEIAARKAYECADAMLAESEKDRRT